MNVSKYSTSLSLFKRHHFMTNPGKSGIHYLVGGMTRITFIVHYVRGYIPYQITKVDHSGEK